MLWLRPGLRCSFFDVFLRKDWKVDENRIKTFLEIIESARERLLEAIGVVREIMETNRTGEFADKFGVFLYELHQSGQSNLQQEGGTSKLIGQLTCFTATMADLGYSTVMANLASAILDRHLANNQDAEPAAQPEQEVLNA